MNINFVSLDIPYPPNHGGAIDIFNRIEAFTKLNWKIFLHCFYFNSNLSYELEKYCNPYSIKSISTTIANSLNKVKSDKLSDRISKNYLWDIIAEKTKKVYEKVVNTSMQ